MGPSKPEIERYALVQAIQKPSSCSLKCFPASRVVAQKGTKMSTKMLKESRFRVKGICRTSKHPTRSTVLTGRQILYNSRFRMSETTNLNATAEPAATETKVGPLDINQIQAILPHRYPFLLIDRVLEIERKKKIVAIKNVTVNEPFFAGHFPNFPIMPGVLIVEAMAQAGGAMLLTEVEDRKDKLIVFTGIEKARFRRPVVPGDQLRIEVVMLSWKEGPSRIAVRMEGKAFVNGKVVCDGTVSAQLVSLKRGQTGSEPAETTE
jgi:3-hydroxyacyl-[acyl-carrier-protein] dehydratase